MSYEYTEHFKVCPYGGPPNTDVYKTKQSYSWKSFPKTRKIGLWIMVPHPRVIRSGSQGDQALLSSESATFKDCIYIWGMNTVPGIDQKTKMKD